MTRNIALFGAREIQDKRRFVTGVTASPPRYQVVDGAGNKEFVVDVYLAPTEGREQDIINDVPIAAYASQVVTDIRLPVTLERSKQGKYTVTGRAKLMAAGAQTPDGSIFEPTYHLVKHNFANLRIQHIIDLDYTLEVLQSTPSTPLQADPSEPLQDISAFDAFGNLIYGSGTPPASIPPGLEPEPTEETTTRHVNLRLAKLGPKGDPLAMNFGTSVLQPTVQEILEIVT